MENKITPVAFAVVVERAGFNHLCNVGDKQPAGYKEVYVVLSKELRRVKIGISDDANERIKQIRTMSPTELEVLYIFRTIGFSFENYLHRKFKHHRLTGEWFTWCEEVAEELQMISDTEDQAIIAFEKRLETESKSVDPVITP